MLRGRRVVELDVLAKDLNEGGKRSVTSTGGLLSGKCIGARKLPTQQPWLRRNLCMPHKQDASFKRHP